MRMSDILEEWAKVQVNWMYLSPIFESKDISKQLPDESKKFKNVDNVWRKEMQFVLREKNVFQICLKETLLDDLKDANEKLEIITKELRTYLKRKRESFARFYFLSDDDLLEILSETKNPTKV